MLPKLYHGTNFFYINLLHLSFPVFQIWLIKRQVDCLSIIVVEAEPYGFRFFDCGQAGAGQFDEQFVFILPGMVAAVVGRRGLLGGGLHFPGIAIGIEDGFVFEFGTVIAPVPYGEYSAFEFALCGMGGLKIDAAVGRQTLGCAVVNMPGVGQAEDAGNHQQQADGDENFFYHWIKSPLFVNFTNLHQQYNIFDFSLAISAGCEKIEVLIILGKIKIPQGGIFMKIKLLATDLDGTLLRGGKPVSAGNIAAAQAAAKAGTIVTIATGRMYRAALPVAEALGLDVPIITYNGALIKSTSGKVYYEQYLDEEICRRITDFAAARGWYLQTYSGDGLYYSDYGEFSRRYEHSQKVIGEDIGYEGMRNKVSKMYKMLIITPDPAVTKDWMAQLTAEFGDSVTLTQSSADFIEIISPGVSKASALVKLAEFLDIDISETMAIGDANNDLPMLKAAGVSVAMGNATDDVKAIADAVTGNCDDDGWAQAIYKYVLKQD